MARTHINWPKLLKVVLLHILFWILVITYFAWGFGLHVDPRKSFLNALFFLPGHFIMVYPLLYFLIPRYLLHHKYWQFFLGVLILIILSVSYTAIGQLSVSDMRDFKDTTFVVGRNVLPFVHIGALASSIKLLKHWYLQRRQTLEAEQQRTVAELKLLKAQLHPHFLFNTLNNLYSHTLESSPKSPEIVLKLSGLLRFMIYESNVARIPLSKEIELLQDYISLEQLRYGERLEMSITINGDVDNYQIAPMLLLPFLENAFKHGTSRQIDQCWISFNIAVEHSRMSFKLINSIDPLSDAKGDRSGGVGLDNVTRRLKLLYKDKYDIETMKLEEVFVVNLNLTLEPLKSPTEHI